ncbi:MAG: aminopeptidase, partial [Alicyclobacillus sp.]|nr:aminopeptidase [Alicyclobacillus sp.]
MCTYTGVNAGGKNTGLDLVDFSLYNISIRTVHTAACSYCKSGGGAQAKGVLGVREQLRKFAELAVKVGVNLQPGQSLMIGFGIRQVLPEHAEFVRHLIEVGYEQGARFVEVEYGDEAWLRTSVQRADEQIWEARARHQLAWIEYLAEQGAAYLAIPATDPDLFHGIDAQRVVQMNRTVTRIFKPFNDKRTNNEYSWSLVSAPTQAWANKVFPHLPEAERVSALWSAILACSRADGEDPVRDWQDHIQRLRKRGEWLRQLRVKTLHYRGPGTDLRVSFHPRHIWASA